ncbi:hypothetical protein [Deinococcus sp.]|uniref:hypothetical protein n=1 Tax=Deinococcus sp. TaxID=47478 RepID=UPI003B5B092B
MLTTFPVIPNTSLITEGDVQAYAYKLLVGATYDVKHHKSGNKTIDDAWPSRTLSSKKLSPGFPDTLLFISGSDRPICVWENKKRGISAEDALKEAKFYVEGLTTPQN